MLVYRKVNIGDLVLDLLPEAMWPCGGLIASLFRFNFYRSRLNLNIVCTPLVLCFNEE